jgi:hypothetical protein
MYSNLDPIEHRAERVVIILVGLIASGKVCPLLFRVVRVYTMRHPGLPAPALTH